jgi:uncharacterized protein (TIGR02118 family)
MITVSVMYPNSDGSTFDMDYYLTKHIPMAGQKLGAALKSVRVDRGLSGIAPGSAPAYHVMCHLGFDSVDAFQASFGPHAADILADIPKYTSAMPTVQISEVKR